MKISENTFEYKKTDNCSILADVYAVSTPHSPVILYIHGGALIFGSRKDIMAKQIELYNHAGFTVASIDYRLAPETKLPAIIEDIQDAFHWVKHQGPRIFHADANRIAVVGSSAGGYLALMAGTFVEKPRAIVSFYGYGDILADWYTSPSEFYCRKPMLTREEAYYSIGKNTLSEGAVHRFLYYLYCRQQGIWPSEVTGYHSNWDQDRLHQFCPIYNITEDYPPTLLLHGDKDTDVPYGESVQMAEELVKHGIDSSLITIKDGDHLFDANMSDPAVAKAFQLVLRFLRSRLDWPEVPSTS